MKSKLEQLQKEEKHIVEQLDQTIGKQAEIKSQMITDRLHTASTLPQQWAALGIKIELSREALTQVRTQIEAELNRITLPNIQ